MPTKVVTLSLFMVSTMAGLVLLARSSILRAPDSSTAMESGSAPRTTAQVRECVWTVTAKFRGQSRARLMKQLTFRLAARAIRSRSLRLKPSSSWVAGQMNHRRALRRGEERPRPPPSGGVVHGAADESRRRKPRRGSRRRERIGRQGQLLYRQRPGAVADEHPDLWPGALQRSLSGH